MVKKINLLTFVGVRIGLLADPISLAIEKNAHQGQRLQKCGDTDLLILQNAYKWSHWFSTIQEGCILLFCIWLPLPHPK